MSIDMAEVKLELAMLWTKVNKMESHPYDGEQLNKENIALRNEVELQRKKNIALRNEIEPVDAFKGCLRDMSLKEDINELLSNLEA